MSFTRQRPASGFTLIELACVCAVIGIILATLAPVIGAQIAQARVSAETAALQSLATAAQASFESSDLEGTNIAAIAGSLPSGVDATNFSTSLDPTAVPATTNTYDWFAKLARQMGDTPLVGVAPTPALQPQVAGILINPNHNTRFMLIGPATETTQQRFLLISLVATPGQLAIPPLPNPSNSQDPADLAGTAAAQVLGDVAVGHHVAGRDRLDRVEHVAGEVIEGLGAPSHGPAQHRWRTGSWRWGRAGAASGSPWRGG